VKNLNYVSILLASDHTLVRSAMRTLLESDPGIKVVGDAPCQAELFGLIKLLKPDLVLVDMHTIRPGDIPILQNLVSCNSGMRTMVVVAAMDIPQAAEIVQLGISGIVLKRCAAPALFDAIRDIMAGIRWIDQGIASDLLDYYSNHTVRDPRTTSQDFRLSNREGQILDAVLAGGSNRDIADRLSISEQTVKHHLTRIYKKIGVSSRLELALFGIKHQLTNAGAASAVVS
jgi:two-component system nitrate/nitrite response regulator NarL